MKTYLYFIIFYITTVFYFLTSCVSASRPEDESKLVDTLSVQSKQNVSPKVEVKIALIDTIIKSGDRITLTIKLTNTGSINQKLLFDKPVISTGGPWATSATVIDAKTKKSVLKYPNKVVLSSQIYPEDQLKDNYYNLIPGQSIEKEYELTDIVVFNSGSYKLPKGSYIIQLLYYNNFSNSLILTIK